MSTTEQSNVHGLELVERQMLIDGAQVPSRSAETFVREAPAYGVPVGRFPEADAEDVDLAVRAARAAWAEWRQTDGATRAKLLTAVADLIRRNVDEISRTECVEAGKPIRQSRDEVLSSAGLWEYAASLARHNYGDAHNALGSDTLAMVVREPAGVVGIITPWNFPLLIVSQKLPFALASGNTAVVKPSEHTPSTTLQLGALLAEAGLPDGVVNIVTGAARAGAAITEHPGIDMLSFTGSTRVGRALAGKAGEQLKKVELELGGKNAQVVFADADLDAAVDAAVFGAYFNVGQCCNSGSRIIVEAAIADEFAHRVAKRAEHVVVGDPLDERTDVGAIVNTGQLEVIESYVRQGREAGANVLSGGNRRDGLFFDPTIFTGVTEQMTIAQEEIFGPVLSILTFQTAEEAVSLANGTSYGLSAGVWSSDVDTALSVARDLRAGTVWVNRWMDGYPELPFGGFAASGLGRELGRQALDAFSELKTIQLQVGARTGRWVDAPDDVSR
ncbi:aldehyde dehydrogenase family protein [Ruania albidiflava]|uniref:aldehyde dehydrogenase family protein n=1 Tax=Ruania albidiflava TaxID=366586 RepID=UPI0003B661BE|nr:aldehyde dehydrogenase family protein [Ruania albidiflava]